MKLSETSEIMNVTYTGPKDNQDRANGYGVMEYATCERRYKYEGYFVHGVRQGFGIWSVAVAEKWSEEFAGWWRDDNPIASSGRRDVVTDFEITQDDAFLERFRDPREVRRLSPSMVEKLRNSDDVYGRYGYAVWLCRMCDDEKSLTTASEFFFYAWKRFIPDAAELISQMFYVGEYYTEYKKALTIDRYAAHDYNEDAMSHGSILAKIKRNYDLFFGRKYLPSDIEAAIAEAEQEANAPGASLLWMEQLGWFYDMCVRNDEAVEAYEKCVIGGMNYPIHDLALMALRRGETEYYEALMKEGIRREVPRCMILGIEKETEWDTLGKDEQVAIHRMMKENLEKGVALGDSYCAYVLAQCYLYEKMGFVRDVAQSMKYARIGLRYRDKDCCMHMIQILSNPEFVALLPEEMRMSEEEIMILMLKALRLGEMKVLDTVIDNLERYTQMGYGEEIDYEWLEIWYEVHKEELDPLDEPEDETAAPIEKITIPPTVLVIAPSGVADYVQADVHSMSSSEMAALIGADRLDAVHFSHPLSEITKSCGLHRQVTMYVDRNAMLKDLDDNMIATILYGQTYEIRGTIIVAMEDDVYDVHAFDTIEDINSVYEAISRLTGGLIFRRLE